MTNAIQMRFRESETRLGRAYLDREAQTRESSQKFEALHKDFEARFSIEFKKARERIPYELGNQSKAQATALDLAKHIVP